MRFRVTFAFCFVAILSAWGVLRAQKPFKEYPAIEYENFPKPPDWDQKAEWVRARLRYPDIYGYPDHPACDQPRWQPFSRLLDHGLSALGSPFAGRHPAADAHRHALGGAGGDARRHRRYLQLAGAVRG